jgi:ATP-binding cassette, subfamily B, multidrug efflux pump
MKKTPPSLYHLVPYLLRYRAGLATGFAMVVCTTASSMMAPWVLKFVIDDLQASFSTDKLPLFALLLLGIAAVEGFFRFWMRKILIGISRDIEFDLRNDFLAHIQKLPVSYFQARSTGDIMSRATNDLNAVRSVLGPGIMYSMSTIITVAAATIILARLNWQLTVLSYVPLALASFTVKKVGQKVHEKFERIQEQFSSISSKAQENLSGIRVVKAFAREETEVREFRKLNREYVTRSVSLIRLWGIFYPLMSALIGLSSVALLWWGGRLVINGKLSLGEFVAFLGYLAMLTWPTIATGWVINIFQRGAASMSRIMDVLQAKPDIADLPGAHAPAVRRGEIEIRDLSFQYPGTDRKVLSGITLRIPAGGTLAIVGRTGSGKSTLLNLIPRLFDPPPGAVLVDGKDIRHWPLQELRRMIGYVPQETFLFSDTIEDNIALGYEATPPPASIERAARISHILEDIRGFPQAFKTMVGERGITLSGGQKQRTALSRAVLMEPRILLLDDALSSVDTGTEEKILQELQEVMRGRTTILVSHRISTVRGADRIIVLKNGAIVEEGSHEQLMAIQGDYFELYNKQLLEEELASA